VNSITPEERKVILDHWTPINVETRFDFKLLLTLIGILCGISILYLYHYSQLKKYNHLLLKLAETDKLTGLYNRSKLDKMLREKYELFLRYNTPCGVAILDIDHFKNINDTYGHQTGDSVLVEISQLMAHSIRTTDVVGRWGGEEFLILAPNSNTHETTKLANKLLEQLRKHQCSVVGTVAASCGVSSFAQGKDIQNTLRLADNALYLAKEKGRDQVICAQQEET
jgi:polar amino acid transport system substrate-binding protein